MSAATGNLKRKALLGALALLLMLSAALFIPAGTVRFAEAWAYLLVFAASTALITMDLMRRDPELLQRRVNAGPAAERERNQQIIQTFASLAFLALFIVAGLDHRFAWSRVPTLLVMVGDVLVVMGFFIVFRVFRENSFTSAVIAVEAEQTVITTGPYKLVRHPMYTGGLLLILATPLALGSLWALLCVLPMFGVIIVRLLDEERVLSRDLPDYVEYCHATRYRLLPGVW